MRGFDYVIVGAGSAGCVLAARLSERSDVTVCLLEAGGSDRHPNVAIPGAFSKLFHSDRDWDYHSEAEPYGAGRRQYMPRGRMIGGSSSMNAMLFARGNAADFDGWAKEHHATGWSYDEVLPYFRRMESYQGGASAYRGASGPLQVNLPRDLNPLTRTLLEAAERAGYPANPDYNAANQEGAAAMQVNVRRGRRQSAADAWLSPARRRRNLVIRTGAHAVAARIVDGRAVGVDVEVGGRRLLVRAEREVILASGAIGSPQLLMLSGVGPAADLEEVGVRVRVDNPNVGTHLQDHPAVPRHYETGASGTLFEAERPSQLLRYVLARRGLLTSTVAEASIWMRSRDGLEAPDIQMLFAPAYFNDHGQSTHDRPAFSIGPCLVAPASRGRIRLRSADPHQPPSILGNHLKERQDVDALLVGLERAREIVETSPLRELTGVQINPGSHVRTREDLEAYLRSNYYLLYHPTSTARIGTPETGVVDPWLRVHGVESLRVADASVFPTITRGNTNAPTYMVAEKASEMILAAG